MNSEQQPRSILTRIRDGVRGFFQGPFSSSDNNPWWRFGAGPVYSGVAVNSETALAVSAFYCGITMISQDIASLPLFLYKGSADGGKQRFDGHPLNKLLHSQPNPEMTSFQLRAALMVNALAGGNGFAEIVRDGAGRPTALWHLLPHRVTVFYQNGQLLYRVANPSGGDSILEPSDILHIKGPSPDGVLGFDVVRLGREALGLSLAAERFGATFFGNGSQLGGALSTPGTLTEQARKNLREALAARHQGSENAHKWMLLENGTTFTPIGVAPQQAQFTELRGHQIDEVARYLRIPSAFLNKLDKVNYSTFEQMQLFYYSSCLRPWLVAIEQELDSKLIAPSEQNIQHFEHSVQAFLRADVEKRGVYYSMLLNNGVATINEIRGFENLPPVPGGDAPRVPLNTTPLNATPVPAPGDSLNALPAMGQTASMLSAQRDVLVALLQMFLRKEIDRARNSQATPEKLKKHIDVFYSDVMQRTYLVENLRPAVKLWLTFTGSDADVDRVCVAIATAHFEQSRAALLNIANGEQNPDDFARALQALLYAWEQNRATDTIDHLVARGAPQKVEEALVKPSQPLSVRTAEIHTKQWLVEAEVNAEKSGVKAPPLNSPKPLLKYYRQVNEAMVKK